LIKKILIPLLLVVLMLGLCSCSDPIITPTEGGTPTPAPSEAFEAKYMKPGDTYKLFYYYLAEDCGLEGVFTSATARDQLSLELGKRMQTEFGIQIKFLTQTGSWFTDYCNSAAAGEPMADMMFAGGPHLMMEHYMWNGIPGSAIISLSDYDYVYKFDDDEYWDTSAQEQMCTYNGELYYFVTRLIGESMVNLNQFTFYNKRLLSDAGYSAETLVQTAKEGNWTWDYFEQVALAVNDPDKDVYALITAQENSLAYNLMASNGGDFVKTETVDGEQVDRFAGWQNESIEAWDFFLDLAKQGLVRPNSMGNEINLFLNGKTAMMMTYLNRADTFYEVVEDDDFFGILPIPKAPGAESYVCTQNWFMPYCVFNNIENPEGTVEFCSIFFRPPYAMSSQESIMLMQAELSTRLRDQASVDFAIESLDYVYPSKMMLYNRTTAQYMWGATDSFLSGETTPAIYYASVRDAYNNEIDKYRVNVDN